MMPRPRSSSPQKKQKYVRWTRESAMKKELNKTNKQVQELNETIQYQQNIIETLSQKLKDLEIIKHQLSKERQDYEELLQQNRFNLKQISNIFEYSNHDSMTIQIPAGESTKSDKKNSIKVDELDVWLSMNPNN